jgi:hypothetical protein
MWVGFSVLNKSQSILVNPFMAEVFKPFEFISGLVIKAK